MTMQRSRQRPCDGPSESKSTHDRGVTKTSAVAPICDAKGDTIMRQAMSPAGISRLINRSCPSAIVGLVIAIIVDPIESVVRRTYSHVLTERREVQPSFTDANTASAVSFEVVTRRSRAAVNHRAPSSIFARFMATLRFPVSEIFSCREFSAKASATRAESIVQAGCTGIRIAPAFAYAVPYSAMGFAQSGRTNHSESAELLTSQIAHLHNALFYYERAA